MLLPLTPLVVPAYRSISLVYAQFTTESERITPSVIAPLVVCDSTHGTLVVMMGDWHDDRPTITQTQKKSRLVWTDV